MQISRCEDEYGTLVNRLAQLTWDEDFSYSLIEYYYNNSIHFGHYKDIAFVLGEGDFRADSKTLDIIIKIIILDDTVIISDILVNYLLCMENKKFDINVYTSLFFNVNLSIKFIALKSLLWLEQKKILKIIELSENNEVPFLLLRKNKVELLIFIEDLTFKKDEILIYLMLVIALIRTNSDKILIENFVLSSNSLEVYNFYYDICCPMMSLDYHVPTSQTITPSKND
ncbi:MAG: Unknown protein [uncultured Sulfurovum sp.]|uniref:Uncharacterized protein n=1 Tax=uncultured Sulfurovum sp. TaxID=269237 RepID=A0A6S6TLE3_9BACT|nr:MAG: Unknown protein [uncultured Sulfurovum sp.]